VARTRDSEAVAVEVAVLEHVLEHGGGAAHVVEVLHDIFARRLQVCDERSRRLRKIKKKNQRHTGLKGRGRGGETICGWG